MASRGIRALAKRAGLRIETVPYCERNGQLAPESRIESGYRRYSDAQIIQLRFIRRAQALGFSLKGIRELLALSEASNVTRVKRVAQEKLTGVGQRIAALERMRDALGALATACPGHCNTADCSIRRALAGKAHRRRESRRTRRDHPPCQIVAGAPTFCRVLRRTGVTG